MKKTVTIAAALMLLVTVCASNSAHKRVRTEDGNKIVEFYDGDRFVQGYILAE